MNNYKEQPEIQLDNVELAIAFKELFSITYFLRKECYAGDIQALTHWVPKLQRVVEELDDLLGPNN